MYEKGRLYASIKISLLDQASWILLKGNKSTKSFVYIGHSCMYGQGHWTLMNELVGRWELYAVIKITLLEQTS